MHAFDEGLKIQLKKSMDSRSEHKTQTTSAMSEVKDNSNKENGQPPNKKRRLD